MPIRSDLLDSVDVMLYVMFFLMFVERSDMSYMDIWTLMLIWSFQVLSWLSMKKHVSVFWQQNLILWKIAF